MISLNEMASKIGIIGVTTSYIPNWELPAHYEGLRFEDAFESAKHYVDDCEWIKWMLLY